MKLIQFEALFIRDFKTTIWPFPLHNHNHFEIMLIKEGKGIHILNNKRTAYSKDSLLFLSPQDTHDFIIAEETHFRVIKFFPNFLKGGINPSNTNFWDNLLTSLQRKLQSHSEIPMSKASIHKIRSIISVLVSDWKENKEGMAELHANLLRSLLLTLNHCFDDPKKKEFMSFGDTTIDHIQNYIHSYICYPERLTVKELSRTFQMSESGIRLFFRKKMDMPLRDYIRALKLQQIKQRIKNSSSTLSEIAQDFGFTDSSHLYRFFLNQTGTSPLAFRKEQ